MLDPVVDDLLKKAQFYYSIGMPEINKASPGYALFTEKLKNKMDNLVAGVRTPWNILVEILSGQFSNNNVLDKAFLQFPNFNLEIQLERISQTGNHLTRSITVVVSLLVDYYTIFFQDTYFFLTRDDRSSEFDGPSYSILYNTSSDNPEYLSYIDQIRRQVEQQFPRHAYIHHKLLFDHQVGGGIVFGHPSASWPSEKHSLYEFLFSNDLYFARMEIVQ